MPTDDPQSRGCGGIEIRSPTAIFEDERAIEGLPIRLVIALLVGVAALSVMMTMIEDVNSVGKSELNVELGEDDNQMSARGTGSVTVTVVDDGNNPVSGAMVTLHGSSARLEEGSRTKESDGNGKITFENVNPSLEPNQDQGTLSIDVHPPNGDFQDKQENTEILVTS